jgi:hypothetical protein
MSKSKERESDAVNSLKMVEKLANEIEELITKVGKKQRNEVEELLIKVNEKVDGGQLIHIIHFLDRRSEKRVQIERRSTQSLNR